MKSNKYFNESGVSGYRDPKPTSGSTSEPNTTSTTTSERIVQIILWVTFGSKLGIYGYMVYKTMNGSPEPYFDS